MSELSDLTALLQEKTVAGKVKWQADYDSRIHTMLGMNIVEIANLDDIEPSMVMITLRNINGVILLREEFRKGTETFEQLKNIFLGARRSSLGVNEALSDLRSHLKAL